MLSTFLCTCWPLLCLLWKSVYSGPLPIFKKSGCFLLLSYLSSLYILDINLLSDVWLASIFSHSVGCLCTLLIPSFAVQKLFSLIQSHLFIFAFVACAFGSYPKKHCQDQCQAFPLCFLTVSDLTFRSLIHLEFIFVYGVRECSNFILLHVAVQFSQHHLLKTVFSPLYILASFVID